MMKSNDLDKEKSATKINSYPDVPKILEEEHKVISDPSLYKDELKVRDSFHSIDTSIGIMKSLDSSISSGSSISLGNLDSSISSGKKPRFNEKTQPNPEKCRFSPFSYHRFARAHKEKAKDGSVIMVLRCRYCFEMQQVIIRFVLKDGRYVATKETQGVKDQNA